MLPGKAKILTCPFCFEKKEVMTVLSYNTFGAIQWSDMKVEMHFNIDVSPVQKCPKCGKYYFGYNQEGEEGENESFELGILSYPEILDAIQQLNPDGLDFELINGAEDEKLIEYFDEKFNLYMTFLHSYNDWFVRNNKDNKHVETKTDISTFNNYMNILIFSIDMLVHNGKRLPGGGVFRGELLREKGEFDECIDWLIKYNEIIGENDGSYVTNQIIKRAKNKDRKVFAL